MDQLIQRPRGWPVLSRQGGHITDYNNHLSYPDEAQFIHEYTQIIFRGEGGEGGGGEGGLMLKGGEGSSKFIMLTMKSFRSQIYAVYFHKMIFYHY